MEMQDAVEAVIRLIPKLMGLTNDRNNGIIRPKFTPFLRYPLHKCVTQVHKQELFTPSEVPGTFPQTSPQTHYDLRWMGRPTLPMQLESRMRNERRRSGSERAPRKPLCPTRVRRRGSYSTCIPLLSSTETRSQQPYLPV